MTTTVHQTEPQTEQDHVLDLRAGVHKGMPEPFLIADMAKKWNRDEEYVRQQLAAARMLMKYYAERPREELRYESIDFWNYVQGLEGVTISQRMSAQLRKEQMLGFRRLARPSERDIESPPEPVPDVPQAEQADYIANHPACQGLTLDDFTDIHRAEYCRKGRTMEEIADWVRRDKERVARGERPTLVCGPGPIEEWELYSQQIGRGDRKRDESGFPILGVGGQHADNFVVPLPVGDSEVGDSASEVGVPPSGGGSVEEETSAEEAEAGREDASGIETEAPPEELQDTLKRELQQKELQQRDPLEEIRDAGLRRRAIMARDRALQLGIDGAKQYFLKMNLTAQAFEEAIGVVRRVQPELLARAPKDDPFEPIILPFPSPTTRGHARDPPD